jgi:hypothetical protein
MGEDAAETSRPRLGCRRAFLIFGNHIACRRRRRAGRDRGRLQARWRLFWKPAAWSMTSPPLLCALACRITAPCSTAFWQRGAVHRRLRRQRRRAFPPAGITRVEAVDRRPSRARRCETNLPTHRDRRRAPGAWNQTVAPAIRWHSSPQRRQPSAQRFVSASAYLSHSSAHASQISAHAWLTCATKRDSRLQNPAHCQQMAAQSRQSRAHSAISGFPMQD